MLASLGIGASTVIAGCMSSSGQENQDNNTTDPTTVVYDDLPEEEQKKLLDEQLEEVYEERVEDGSLIKGHNIEIAGVDSITDTSVDLETTISLNPIDDYTIKLHYHPVTTNRNGEWVFKNSTDPFYGQNPEYNHNSDTWIPSDRESNKKIQYEFQNTNAGSQVSSLTIPSEAYWDEDVTVGEDRIDIRAFFRKDIHDHGWSHLVEFDIDTTPEMYETFVYTLTWEDENTNSSRSGEIVANTPPILRIGKNKYIHPLTHNGNTLTNPNWGSSHYRNDDRGYTMENVYQTDIDGSDINTIKANVTRLSQYGRLSPRTRNEFSTYSSVNSVGYDTPAYLDAHPQFPWAISYEINRSTIQSARETAMYHQSGEDEVGRIKALLNASEVMNHRVVRDVASQLGDVCDMMNMTTPVEQIRVVADFVQYFSHASEDNQFGQPSNTLPGTSHPVITLARGLGDCKDYTVLGNAILQQSPFNLNPDAVILPNIFDYIDESERERSAGHISTTIPTRELGIDESVFDNVSEPVYATKGLVNMNNVKHAYIEMSGPFEIGYVSSRWLQSSHFVPIDRY